MHVRSVGNVRRHYVCLFLAQTNCMDATAHRKCDLSSSCQQQYMQAIQRQKCHFYLILGTIKFHYSFPFIFSVRRRHHQPIFTLPKPSSESLSFAKDLTKTFKYYNPFACNSNSSSDSSGKQEATTKFKLIKF